MAGGGAGFGWTPENWFVPAVDQGQPDPGDPMARAALQESYAFMAQQAAKTAASVPQTYLLQGGPNPLSEMPPAAVAGNLPRIGWTCQKDTGSPFGPYAPTMQTPDWTSDPNSIAAGRFDQNQAVNPAPFDRANIAPIGSAVFDGYSEIPNPNVVPMDNQSLMEDLEY